MISLEFIFQEKTKSIVPTIPNEIFFNDIWMPKTWARRGFATELKVSHYKALQAALYLPFCYTSIIMSVTAFSSPFGASQQTIK